MAGLPFTGAALDVAATGVLRADDAFFAGATAVGRVGTGACADAVFFAVRLVAALAAVILGTGTSPAMTLLNPLPADTRGAFLALTRIASPVAGLRPLRALRAT